MDTLLENSISRIKALLKAPPKDPVRLLGWAHELNQITSQLYGGLWHEKTVAELNKKAEAAWQKPSEIKLKGKSPKHG